MDCCAFTEKAWGKYSVLKFSPQAFDKVIGLKPDEIIEVDEVSTDANQKIRKSCAHDKFVTKFYSSEEILSTITTDISANYGSVDQESININDNDTMTVVPLVTTFKNLVVRIMHSGKKVNDMITDEMMQHYCAEGVEQVLFAKNARRYRYPLLTHGQMFAQSNEILKCVNEIAFQLQQE